MIHRSWLNCCLLESKSSAQEGSDASQSRYDCFNNQLQESLAASEWIITRFIFFPPSPYFNVFDLFVSLLMSFFFCSSALSLSPISPACRATSNNKVKEMVLLELSYVNSNLQLLMGQLEGLNSSVEVYQNTQ